MLEVVVLGLLPAYATGQLMTTDAKCLPGYEWTFNTLNQSPCDVAASLAAVCAPNGKFNLDPLPPGYVYSGPTTEFANSCRCSSVYYSMLSACGYCQARSFHKWSEYRTNCPTVSLQSYNQPLPTGVKVPAWAYLNVLDGDNFNITLAQRTPVTPSSTTSSSSLPTSTGSRTNVGAIAGGAAGGVVLIIIALITIFWLRKRRATKSESPLALPPPAPRSNTSPSLFQAELNSFDGGVVDSSSIWPQQSPLAPSLITHFTGSSGRQTAHPQKMMSQTQSDTPTQYAMVAPQNIFTPHTMAPTRVYSAQSLSHQTQNTAPPALGQTYTSQNVISAPPRQNSTQYSMSTPSGQNLRQGVISNEQSSTQYSISTPSRQNLRQSVISNEQSPTQDGTSTPLPQKMKQDTIPLVQDIPPPQYSFDPY